MSKNTGLIDGDDGFPADSVHDWAIEKHELLCRYAGISSGVRKKFISGPGGATYIDLFCGTGRSQVTESLEWIDGGAVAAWKQSVADHAPFSKVYIGDLDPERLDACEKRLKKLGAPVSAFLGAAQETAPKIVNEIQNNFPNGLHLAFLDPYSLGALDFRILETLANIKRIDMMIHFSQMDFQRNFENYVASKHSPLDCFAPGWRDHVEVTNSQHIDREQFFKFWKEKIQQLNVDFKDADMKLITGSRKQPLYWLLLAAKHNLALKFWNFAADDKQGVLF
jgi:three-Cys-motif partner protein